MCGYPSTGRFGLTWPLTVKDRSRMTEFLPATRSGFLSHLPAADLALLQPHLQDIPLAVGTRLHQAGNPIDYAYFPHSGLVSLLVPYHSGAAVEAGLVGPEGIVDGLATMGVETCFTDATVQVSGHAARIH